MPARDETLGLDASLELDALGVPGAMQARDVTGARDAMPARDETLGPDAPQALGAIGVPGAM